MKFSTTRFNFYLQSNKQLDFHAIRRKSAICQGNSFALGHLNFAKKESTRNCATLLANPDSNRVLAKNSEKRPKAVRSLLLFLISVFVRQTNFPDMNPHFLCRNEKFRASDLKFFSSSYFTVSDSDSGCRQKFAARNFILLRPCKAADILERGQDSSLFRLSYWRFQTNKFRRCRCLRDEL